MIYSDANLQELFNLCKNINIHLHLRKVFPVILVVKALDSHCMVLFKSAAWLQDQSYFSLSSRLSWLNEYQKLLGTYSKK